MYITPQTTLVAAEITGINVLQDVCDLSSKNLCVCDDIYRLNAEINGNFSEARRHHFIRSRTEYSCLADALDAPLNSFLQFHNYYPILGLSVLQFILVVHMLSNFWSDLLASQKGDVADNEYEKIPI